MSELIQVGQLDGTFESTGRIYSAEGLSPTLNTCGGGQREVKIAEQNNYRIRKLTPREVWRLMCFEDTDIDNASEVVSNSQLYKQAGNSICVCVLEAIFGQMLNGGYAKFKERWANK